MNTLQTGLWAGMIANGPMTLALMKMQEASPELNGTSLPPGKFTNEFLGPAEDAMDLSSNRRVDLSFVSHMLYGTAFALVYALGERRVKASPLIKGGVFGAGVWAISYLGWAPALKLQPAATRVGLSRNVQMVLAHLV